MKIIKNQKKLRQLLDKEQANRKSVGLVPTMGALHEGHLSLVRVSCRENDVTVASVFVNPTQFGPKEDLKKYPKTLAKDKLALKKRGVDYLFFPSVKEMYPEGLSKPAKIKNAQWPVLAKGLCGKFRPGHFQGVVTVVTKLLDAVRPHRFYLGAKDYQQAVILTQLVKDLGGSTKVRMLPSVREKDGLALSSRNRFLSPADRYRAQMIAKILFKLRADLKKRKGSISSLQSKALRELKQHVDKVQYLEVVDAATLEPLKSARRRMVAAVACFVGKTRLIDNVIINLS